MSSTHNKPVLKLDWCSHEAAKYAVEHWHYSMSMLSPPVIKIGVWEDDAFIGCVFFSRGANNNLGKSYGLTNTQICELTRVALTVHKNQVSRIIAIALRLLKRQSPGLRLVVSYADPYENHHGGIYQAGNWIYDGSTKSDWAVIDKNGRRHHSRIASESGIKSQFGRKTRVIKPSEGTKISLPGKHRYLMPLDAEMRKQIKPLSKPYPKRAPVAEVSNQ